MLAAGEEMNEMACHGVHLKLNYIITSMPHMGRDSRVNKYIPWSDPVTGFAE
jgi:hypothetical protein